jgi:hypothetical protein
MVCRPAACGLISAASDTKARYLQYVSGLIIVSQHLLALGIKKATKLLVAFQGSQRILALERMPRGL